MNLKPEELVKALRSCSDLPTGNSGCAGCMFASLYEPACTDLLLRHAADQIERDQKEIAALREKVPQWISVEDRMPDTVPCDAGTEYSEAVVVWTNGNKAMIAVWDGIDWICQCDFWEAWGEEITHWMPLPEPPKEDTP